MSDNKILQAILDGLVSIRRDIKRVGKKIGKIEEKLTARIDKLGAQLAYLDEDAPTREEHDNLDERVVKLEQQAPSN